MSEEKKLGSANLRCPICGGRPAHIYVCSHCGEVRCGQTNCTGSEGGDAGWASSGTQCRHCGDGRYRILNFHSQEFADFQREYALRMRQDESSWLKRLRGEALGLGKKGGSTSFSL
ncbi:hypothetical protein [Magnetofaba australis]|uniref:hypothetical protein n=1 Tax=Magnetofaba australis TaxID=1472297 RepID=UPI0018E9217A|nr:hypothetical protein [Magnetofaba australis]